MDIIKYYYWMQEAALTFSGWHSLAGRSGQLPGSVRAVGMTENGVWEGCGVLQVFPEPPHWSQSSPAPGAERGWECCCGLEPPPLQGTRTGGTGMGDLEPWNISIIPSGQGALLKHSIKTHTSPGLTVGVWVATPKEFLLS